MKRHTLLLSLLLASIGCAVSPDKAELQLAPVPPDVRAWSRQFGGCVRDDARQQRALSALARLRAAQDSRLAIYVLRTERVAAYAWSQGAVFVSCGLLDVMDDDELVAVVAHEMGHLLADGHMEHPSALAGASALLDAESRADQLGCLLLSASDMDPSLMLRMLRKLQAHVAPSVRPHIRARIQALNQTSPQPI